VNGPLGLPRLHLRATDSTNERARELALAGAVHGTLVTADEQSAGRGRQGRTWIAPAGSAVLMSLVLREPPPLLPLAAAVAVCDAVGAPARVKWPNDVVLELADGRLAKLAGILVEARPGAGWAVLGIGINAALDTDELPDEIGPASERPAASLKLTPQQREPLLAGVLAALERRIAEDREGTLGAWRELDALCGRSVAWDGGSGTADGIDGEGRLKVLLDAGGSTALAAGEVHLRR